MQEGGNIMSDWLISKQARATQIVQSDEQFVTHSF